MKALVVESSSTMRSVLRRILSMRGFVVTETGDAQGALDILNRPEQSDIAIVQWNMQDIKTLELIARLRNKPPHKTTIILLADAEPGIRELKQTIMVGADEFLVKPFRSLQIDGILDQAGLNQHMGGSADQRGLRCR